MDGLLSSDKRTNLIVIAYMEIGNITMANVYTGLMGSDKTFSKFSNFSCMFLNPNNFFQFEL